MNQAPNTAMPRATEIARTIRVPRRLLITPDSAVSEVATPLLPPEGPGGLARPAPGAAGAGVTTGSSRARLPPGAGAVMPGTVPRGSADGWVSGPARPDPAEVLLLWPGGAGAPCDAAGDGDLDLPVVGELLGHGDLFGEDAGPGESDVRGHGDLLGEGEGLGEDDLLGDGDGDGDGEVEWDGDGLGDGEGDDVLGEGEGLGAAGDVLGEGDGAALDRLGDGDGDAPALAPAAGRTASTIPAAIAPPRTMARAPARGRVDRSPW